MVARGVARIYRRGFQGLGSAPPNTDKPVVHIKVNALIECFIAALEIIDLILVGRAIIHSTHKITLNLWYTV